MADDEHRRVEAHTAVVGSGMLTDPERIRSIEGEKARRERAWREAPKRGFGDVLKEAPARNIEEGSEESEEQAAQASAGDDSEAEAPDGAAAVEGLAEADVDVPRVAPDPRMAALNSMFEPKRKAAAAPTPVPEASMQQTPPAQAERAKPKRTAPRKAGSSKVKASSAGAKRIKGSKRSRS